MKIICLTLLSLILVLSALGAGKALCLFLFLPSGESLQWGIVAPLAFLLACICGIYFCKVSDS